MVWVPKIKSSLCVMTGAQSLCETPIKIHLF